MDNGFEEEEKKSIKLDKATLSLVVNYHFELPSSKLCQKINKIQIRISYKVALDLNT